MGRVGVAYCDKMSVGRKRRRREGERVYVEWPRREEKGGIEVDDADEMSG